MLLRKALNARVPFTQGVLAVGLCCLSGASLAQSLPNQGPSPWSLAFEEIVATQRHISYEDAEGLESVEIAFLQTDAPDTLRRRFGYSIEEGPYTETEVLNPYNGREEWQRSPVALTRSTREGTRLTRVDGSTRLAQAPLEVTVALLDKLEDVAYGRATFGYADAASAFDLTRVPGMQPAIAARSEGDVTVVGEGMRVTANAGTRRLTITDYATEGDARIVREESLQLADGSELFGVEGALVHMQTVSTTWDTLASGAVVTRVITKRRGNHRLERGSRVEVGVGGSVGVYPNPVLGHELTVSFPAEQVYPLSIQVVDPSGRILFRDHVDTPEGPSYYLRLPEQLPPGNYFLRVISDAEQSVARFTITQ